MKASAPCGSGHSHPLLGAASFRKLHTVATLISKCLTLARSDIPAWMQPHLQLRSHGPDQVLLTRTILAVDVCSSLRRSDQLCPQCLSLSDRLSLQKTPTTSSLDMGLVSCVFQEEGMPRQRKIGNHSEPTSCMIHT